MHFRLLHFDSLDSTNREAADHARRGADEGITIVADEQTAGRGRQGREWISKKGVGAYFSTILRPKIKPRHYTLVPLTAAVAVYDALRKGWLVDPDIKWPNDILVGEKKISGILSEMVDTPAGHAIILGIGINLRDADGALNATSMEAESPFPAERDDVIGTVHDQLAIHYQTLLADPLGILEEWSRRSSYFDGKDVMVDLGEGDSYVGTTTGLEDNGALRVMLPGGSIKVVQAGDVTRLRRV